MELHMIEYAKRTGRALALAAAVVSALTIGVAPVTAYA